MRSDGIDNRGHPTYQDHADQRRSAFRGGSAIATSLDYGPVHVPCERTSVNCVQQDLVDHARGLLATRRVLISIITNDPVCRHC